MAWYEAGGLMIGLIVVFMALGMHVAFAFFAANILGVVLFIGSLDGVFQLVDNSTALLTTYTLVPVPLFLLMGELFFETGLAVRVFDAIDRLFGRLPGRLSYVAVAGGTMFAGLSGSSMASTAMLGTMLVPEMSRRGYATHMSIGPIMATGGLASLIPPSALAVLLGSIGRLDIGALLVAGLVPGLVLAGLYLLLIYVQVRTNPAVAPSYDIDALALSRRLALFAVNILPVVLILCLVVAMILTGIATPSEAAGFGVLAVLAAAAIFGRLSFAAIGRAFEKTMRVTGMVFLILMASSTFSQILAVSGASTGLVDWVVASGFSRYAVLAFMFLTILALGAFMDSVSIMLVTLPLFLPVAAFAGFDPIWFGIVVLIGLEMGFTTPPFGLLLFIVLGVAPRGTTLGQVIGAALPYLGCNLVLLALMILFPSLVLFLPELIR